LFRGRRDEPSNEITVGDALFREATIASTGKVFLDLGVRLLPSDFVKAIVGCDATDPMACLLAAGSGCEVPVDSEERLLRGVFGSSGALE
jgi:hypothetical protein